MQQSGREPCSYPGMEIPVGESCSHQRGWDLLSVLVFNLEINPEAGRDPPSWQLCPQQFLGNSKSCFASHC